MVKRRDLLTGGTAAVVLSAAVGSVGVAGDLPTVVQTRYGKRAQSEPAPEGRQLQRQSVDQL